MKMKKKFLLTLLIALTLMCLFAIAISAEGSTLNEYGDITLDDGVAEPSVIDSTSKAVIKGSDGLFYTIPSYYLLEDKATVTWKLIDCVKNITGASKASDLKNYVVRMEIPENITALGSDMFKKSTSLIEVKFPTTLTDIGVATFAACKTLTTAKNLENTKITKLQGQSTATYNNDTGCFANCSALTEINLPSTVTYIEQWAATTCTSLTKVTVPKDAKITYIGQYAFEKSLITEFYFSSELTYIGKGAFEKTKLTNLENFENTQLTEIVEYSFHSCSITNIKLPSKLTKIGQYAFGGHKAVQDKLVIPNGVTEIGKCAFAGNYTAIKEIVLPGQLTTLGVFAFEKNAVNVIYIPSTLTAIPEGLFKDWGRSSNNNTLFVYTGSLEQLNALIAGANTSNNGDFTTDAKKNIKSAVEYGSINVSNVSGESIVYGYNACDAFYNSIHELDPEKSNACAGVCKNCGEKSYSANPEHEFTTIIEYTDYCSVGTKTQTCSHEGCQYAEGNSYVTDAPAIITSFQGISTKINGDGLTIDYIVNYDALDEYSKTMNKSIELGFVVSAYDKTGDKPLDNESAVKAPVLTWKYESDNSNVVKYTGLSFRLEGNWDQSVDLDGNGEKETSMKDIKFCMAGYIIDNGALSYINVGGTSDTADFNSYNGVTSLE